MASILFLFYMLFFPYHSPVYNLFSDSAKKLFLCYRKPIVLKQKTAKNSQENSLGNDQNFGKNSFKITLKQL